MENESAFPSGIINPFSEKFSATWKLWKDYRWQEHKFKYKGCISEQVKLIQLAQMAENNEDVAIAIVMQSIGNGWSGFFHLKTVKVNGTGKQKQPVSNDEARQQLNKFYNDSSGRWG